MCFMDVLYISHLIESCSLKGEVIVDIIIGTTLGCDFVWSEERYFTHWPFKSFFGGGHLGPKFCTKKS